MRHYRVTPKALEDLKRIGRYTHQQWGKEQRNSYLKKLERRFAWLAANPKLGKYRPEVGDGYFSFPESQHIVFYLINSESIDIIGIPHKHMDIIHYFDTP